MRMPGALLCVAAACLGATAATVLAQPAPPITLAVDASEAPRRIFHVREKIPAPPGPLILVYPKWIPGEHSPDGLITELVGLKMSAAGQTLSWRRDPLDMWSFACDVPAGSAGIDVAFDYVAPLTSYTTGTANLAVVNWWSVLLYPGGSRDNAAMFSASLRLPSGWKYGTSLPVARDADGTIAFAPVTLVTLVDSPVLAGLHFKTVDLTPGERPGHWLHIAGESAAAVAISPEDAAHYRNLVAEARALFGARHYDDYHFLLALSDHVPQTGLEHHESSDNRGRRAGARRRLGEKGAGLAPLARVRAFLERQVPPARRAWCACRRTTSRPWTATCSGSTKG